MSALMTIFKILSMIWPFVKEMVFGDKTMSEIIRDNKLKFGIFVLIVALTLFSAIAVNRIIVISNRYMELERKYKEAISSPRAPAAQGVEVKKVEKPPLPNNEQVQVAETPPDPKRPHPAPKKKDEHERYNRLQHSFEELRRLDEDTHRSQ